MTEAFLQDRALEAEAFSIEESASSGYIQGVEQHIRNHTMLDSKALAEASGKRAAAGVCGILLGSFGIHKFILGYYLEGFIMLTALAIVFVCSCGILTPLVHLVGLIEGVFYLLKSDEQFYETYIAHKRRWF